MKLNRFWIGSALMLWLGVLGSAAASAEEPATPAPAVMEDNLDNLEFASGETTSFDAAAGKLQVKVYLDDAGNPSENTIELNVDKDTEITNGEKDLDASALKTGVEIDVEYDKNSNKATYVFVY